MTDPLRAALRALAAPLPPGSAVTVTVPREALLELVDGGDGPDPAPALEAPVDRLLTAREAAARLGVSTRYLYQHRTDYPFTKRLPSGRLRFSERGLARFLERT